MFVFVRLHQLDCVFSAYSFAGLLKNESREGGALREMSVT